MPQATAAQLRRMRPGRLPFFVFAGAAACAILRHGFLPTLGFVGARAPAQPLARGAVRLAAKGEEEIKFLTNNQIKAIEVRVIAEAMPLKGTKLNVTIMEDCNEVMLFKQALTKAKSRGMDLILIDENADPPAVKIAKYGKFLFEEGKKRKELTRKGKMPKLKEVKMSYTIGEHDLGVHLSRMEKWFEDNRQQVKVTIQLKGRSRMFQNQARQILVRVRREIAAYGSAVGAGRGDPITKDGRGDLIMLLQSGPDRAILKELQKEALAQGVTLDAEEEADDDDEDGEDEEEAGPMSAEISELEKEIKEMREELEDCGIRPGEIDRQPEMVDLFRELNKLKRAAMSAGMTRPTRTPFPGTSSLFVVGAVGVAAVSFRPRRYFGRHL